MTRHILLIPADNDPHGLLAEGVCGSRTPTAWLHERASGDVWLASIGNGVMAGEVNALVLAWDGVPVAEGCDRAARVISTLHIGMAAPYTIRSFAPLGRYDLVSRGFGYPYGVMDRAQAWRETGIGRVVVVESP